jgi:ribonuclease J
MIPYLKPDIRLIGSETTENIMQYLQDTMAGDEQEFCSWSPSFRLIAMSKGGGMRKANREDVADEKIERPFIRIKRKQVHHELDLEVTAYHVDHSLPGSNGYILDTSSGVVAYTGDLRFHGHFSKASNEFADALEESDVHVLLCEGTRVNEAQGLTEDTLEAKMTGSINNVKGLVLVNYAQRDASRIATISKAAAACGRKLLVNPKQAYYLWKLSSSKDLPTIDTKNIEVLLPRKSWGIWGNSDYDSKIQQQDYLYSYPRSVRDYIFNHSVLATPQEVSTAQNKYVVTCSFSELGLLHDLQPKAGSQFIWSSSEPFDEEGEIEMDRVRNWLNDFGLGEPVMMHCSGHLSGTEVGELIERVQPDMVVPIHTEHPTIFKKWHKNVKILERNAVLEI